MPENRDHCILVPLFECLDGIGFGQHGEVHHFNTGTLFWSLTRLFGCYERVMEAVPLERHERPFLEADVEHYLIRFRIVLNDVAFIVRQLLPADVRGLKGPSGSTHPRNREMSIFALWRFLEQNAVDYPELAQAFAGAQEWMMRLRTDRDNVVHYKSKVVIFEPGEGHAVSFAILNAAGTERKTRTEDGSERLALEPVAEFVNAQLFALHSFMHSDLTEAIKSYANRVALSTQRIGWDNRITCIGIKRFKLTNGIGQ